jgi:hypothetical protein
MAMEHKPAAPEAIPWLNAGPLVIEMPSHPALDHITAVK